jgi:hypothetical protein
LSSPSEGLLKRASFRSLSTSTDGLWIWFDEAWEVIDRLDPLQLAVRAPACACVELVPLAVRTVLSPNPRAFRQAAST